MSGQAQTPGQAAHPLDLPAMAAYAARFGCGAQQAADIWAVMNSAERENWRMTADAAIMAHSVAAQERPAPGSQPSDAAISAWIENYPREFATWVDTQRRLGGPAPGCPNCDGSATMRVPYADSAGVAELACPHPAHEAAAAPAQPGSLRADLEETLANWRDNAAYRPTDTRDEMNEHHGVSACADTLAGILADHPDTEQPRPAPGERELDDLREKVKAAEQEAIDARSVMVETFAMIAVLADGKRPAQHKANELRKRAGLLPGAVGDTGDDVYPDSGEPQPAPEMAAAMAESRRYRAALAQVASMAEANGAARNTGNIAKVARRALEGK